MNVRRDLAWVVGLVAVMWAEAQMVRNPDGETVGALLAALTAFVLIDRFGDRLPSRGPTVATHPNDPPLLRKLLRDLPPDEVVFFREHDFAGSFEGGPVSRLREFAHRWTAPDHHFQDARLEQIRVALVAAAKHCVRTISFKTRPAGEGWLTVKPSRDVGEEQRELVRRDAEEMNRSAEELVKVYDALVIAGCKRLNIASPMAEAH